MVNTNLNYLSFFQDILALGWWGLRRWRIACKQKVNLQHVGNPQSKLLFLLQHKGHYQQNKTKTTYNTTNDTLLIYYLLYNTSLEYNSYTTFTAFFITHLCTWWIAMPNRFPLSLQHLTTIILSSNVTFSFLFSFT